MKKEMFEMCFEMVEIDNAFESGYKNTFDISVSGDSTFLLGDGIVSHNSATAGLIGPLERENCGFYELKGKPLNAWSSNTAKFTANKELSELFSIIQNEGYLYIIPATDQDLDGIHIRGLLIGFFERYLPEYKKRIGLLNTPVIGVKKNKKLIRWFYNLNSEVKLKSGEESKYYKGLGSWTEKDLTQVIKTDGIEKMIELLNFDSTTCINEWLGEKEADTRKKYIMNNSFSITSI